MHQPAADRAVCFPRHRRLSSQKRLFAVQAHGFRTELAMTLSHDPPGFVLVLSAAQPVSVEALWYSLRGCIMPMG